MATEDKLNADLERILTGLRSDFLASLRKAAEDLVRTMPAERERAVASATAEVRRQAQEQLAQLREAARKQTDDIRMSAETQVSDLRRALDELRSSTERQIESARRTLDSEMATIRAKASAEVEEVRRTSSERVAELDRELVAARAALEQMEARAREMEARAEQAEDAQARGTAEAGRFQLLAGVLKSIDASQSLVDGLERLLTAARELSDQSTLLLVEGETLRQWRASGLEGTLGADARQLSQAAAESKSVETRFGHDGRDAVAVPVTVAGVPVVVLYAESPSGTADAEGWAETIELIARHTSRVLETTTVHQAAGMLASGGAP